MRIFPDARGAPDAPTGGDDAGWSSPVARWAHNPKVAGSNPAPATKFEIAVSDLGQVLIGGVAQLAEHMVCNHGVRGSNPLTSTKADAISRDLSAQFYER